MSTLSDSSERVVAQHALVSEDTDAILQFMVFLKRKLLRLEGTKFVVVMYKENDEKANATLLYQKLGFEIIQLDSVSETFNEGKRVFIFHHDRVVLNPIFPLIRYFSDGIDFYLRLSRPKREFKVHSIEDLLIDKSLKIWMKAIVDTILAPPRKG